MFLYTALQWRQLQLLEMVFHVGGMFNRDLFGKQLSIWLSNSICPTPDTSSPLILFSQQLSSSQPYCSNKKKKPQIQTSCSRPAAWSGPTHVPCTRSVAGVNPAYILRHILYLPLVLSLFSFLSPLHLHETHCMCRKIFSNGKWHPDLFDSQTLRWTLTVQTGRDQFVLESTLPHWFWLSTTIQSWYYTVFSGCSESRQCCSWIGGLDVSKVWIFDFSCCRTASLPGIPACKTSFPRS